MHFSAIAELWLDALAATGQPPVPGEVVVFTPDDAGVALGRGEPDWVGGLPEPDYWREHAPSGATWLGAFRPTEEGRIPSPPPNRGDHFELLCGDRSFPGTVINETDTTQEPPLNRYLIAGIGHVPEPPESGDR